MSFGSAEALGRPATTALQQRGIDAAQSLTTTPAQERLTAAAAEFEKVFVAEMLKNAGLDDAVASADSGFGADAYRSFLVDAYAEALVEQQSFGLAERLYDDLRARFDATPLARADQRGASDVA